MRSTRYIAGVRWGPSGKPTVGYSNFNRSCAQNWTDYNDGRGWVLNSEDNLGPGQDINTCSWPMMRVEVEVRSQQDECTENSQSVR